MSTSDRVARTGTVSGMLAAAFPHHDSMKIGYVCTNYNNSAFTRAAIESLHLGASAGRVHCVVVDNDSSPSDVEALRELGRSFPDVEIVFGGTNAGYFPGLNIGLRRLRAAHPGVDHVVVGNNDLVFPPDFVERMERRAASFEKWAVVAPDLVSSDGLHQNPHVLHPITPARRLVWRMYYSSYAAAFVIGRLARLTRRFTSRAETRPDHGLHRTAGPIIVGLGACYILGPVFFRHFDCLYAPSFLMDEEFFLAEQLNTIGQSTYYEPEIVVFHHGAATTTEVPSRRLWEMARDSHRIYDELRVLPAERRRELIARGSRGIE